MVHRFAYLDSPVPLAFAHRGGSSGLENSVAAFQSVVDLGFRYLELDVRATADGVLVVFHDEMLDRVTDRVGRVAALPYAEVARARVAGSEPIPLLEDVLGSFPDVRVNVDVKELSAVRPLVEVIRRTNAVDRVCVAAFSDRRVRMVGAALGPRLCTALGPRGAAALRFASYVGWPRTGFTGWRPCAQVPVRAGALRVVDRRFVDAAHERGVQVHVWTVDEPGAMHALLDLGVDGIMTDRPEALRAVLVSRGRWHG
ncbi:MAG TPA: glycerophosphodiester phosphodiesterase [Mycobacteriales bacterium]|nr:glycerophosphodiester phosphodiesterase [Mycobacteriales bacterium]